MAAGGFCEPKKEESADGKGGVETEPTQDSAQGVVPDRTVAMTDEKLCPGRDWQWNGGEGRDHPVYELCVRKLGAALPPGEPLQDLERDPSQAFIVSLAVPRPGMLPCPQNLASRTRWTPRRRSRR